MLTSRMASGQLKVATPFKSSCGSARLPQAALKGRCHTIKCLAVQDAVPLAARGDAHSTGRLESSKDEVRPPSRRWMIGSAMASMAFLSCPCCTGVAKASEGGPAGWSYGEYRYTHACVCVLTIITTRWHSYICNTLVMIQWKTLIAPKPYCGS